MPSTDINSCLITFRKYYLSAFTLVYLKTSTYKLYCSASKSKTHLTLDNSLSQTTAKMNRFLTLTEVEDKLGWFIAKHFLPCRYIFL